MTNREIARVLYEMSVLYEMQGVPFKPGAYERAAAQLEALETSAGEILKAHGLKGLMESAGVGRGMAEHIEELLNTGRFDEYEKIKSKIPVNISELMKVDAVGPRTIKTLYEKLGIRDLTDLENAARSGKIRELPKFGEKSEKKIIASIEFLKKSTGRHLLGSILPEVRRIEQTVRGFPEVKHAVIAGSLRRRKETIGDIDLVVTSKKPESVMRRFLKLPHIQSVHAQGPTKLSVHLKLGLDLDLRVVPEEALGAALLYFTGSKDHNIALREIAVKKKWKLNEYGLFDGDRNLASETEEEIYKKLGLPFIHPEMREDAGEIQLAKKGKLPDLINYGDLKGDLQIQTEWTDGADSIEAMALAAKAQGMEYIVITDHTKNLAMAGGCDEIKLRKQMVEIDAVNERLQKQKQKIRVLKGSEVDILKDGTLDLSDEVLSELDVVGASIHSHFGLPRAEQTQRVLRAMENPHVDILFHPTARLILKREPIDVDLDAVIETAKRTGTVLEINSLPDRLDLRDDLIRKCLAAKVKLVIDSDAHSAADYRYLELGIAQARRGWASAKDILNTLPLNEFLKRLKG